jgi:hypothetical protein
MDRQVIAPSAGGAMVPVSDVRSARYTAAEGGEGLETHTHSIGVIVPPPDIKAIADKTAQFVARNGEFGLLMLFSRPRWLSMHYRRIMKLGMWTMC